MCPSLVCPGSGIPGMPVSKYPGLGFARVLGVYLGPWHTRVFPCARGFVRDHTWAKGLSVTRCTPGLGFTRVQGVPGTGAYSGHVCPRVRPVPRRRAYRDPAIPQRMYRSACDLPVILLVVLVLHTQDLRRHVTNIVSHTQKTTCLSLTSKPHPHIVKESQRQATIE